MHIYFYACIYYLQRQSSSNTNNHSLHEIVNTDEEWCLSHIDVICNINKFCVARVKLTHNLENKVEKCKPAAYII